MRPLLRLSLFAVPLAIAFAAGCSSQHVTPNGPGAAPNGAVADAGARATPAPAPSVTPSAPAVCLPQSNPTQMPVTNAPQRLSSYHVDPSKVFVAGISSGGFFAVQMHLAHSSTFHGAAIYAGGVDYCAQDSVELALADCGGETLPNCHASYANTLAQSEAYLDTASSSGAIDPESNVRGQPVYLWSGTKDQVVNPLEMDDLRSEYAHYGANVTYDSTYPANHGWESPDGTVPCGTAEEPYVLACAKPGTTKTYDSVRTWMKLFFGPLAPRREGALRGSLVQIDQTEFGASAANSMDTAGYLFAPQSCERGQTCGLVVAFHGCLQDRAFIGTTFVTQAGIDEWADSNRVLVLYPYAVPSQGVGVPYNPNGCWEWWGYDDPNYATKGGTQIGIVYKMVERITAPT